MKKRSRISYLEETTYPAIIWLLEDWSRWTRTEKGLPDLEDLDWEPEPQAPEAFYIGDDDALRLERELKALEVDHRSLYKLTRMYYLRRMSFDAIQWRFMSPNGRPRHSLTGLRAMLRNAEYWLEARNRAWVDPLYQKHLAWEEKKKNRTLD